jgi:hypothetical protein
MPSGVKFQFHRVRELLCALVNPGANQADLPGRQSVGRRTEAARPARSTLASAGTTLAIRGRTAASGAWTARRTISTGAARTVFGWHRNIVVDLGGCGNEQALLGIARNYHFAGFAALKRWLKAVQPQIPFLSLVAVATETRRFEQWPNVFVVRDALGVSGRRQFAQVHFGNVPLVVGHSGPTCHCKAKSDEWGCGFHSFVMSFFVSLLVL